MTQLSKIPSRLRYRDDHRLAAGNTSTPRATEAELCAAVAHELQTPIASLQGLAYLLEKQCESLPATVVAGIKRLLAMQSQAITEMKTIVESLLESRAPSAVAAAEAPPVVSLAVLFRTWVSMFNLSLANGRVKLNLRLDESYRVTLSVSKIRLILDNLVSNALKYSPRTSDVDVTVAEEGAYWRLQVSDRGRGIPVADQARLFRPYARASNVGEVPGVGLGLFLVREAVQTCGGTLEYRTSAETGTTFVVRLPRDAVDPLDS
jgi:signal transduction histidine kinase